MYFPVSFAGSDLSPGEGEQPAVRNKIPRQIKTGTANLIELISNLLMTRCFKISRNNPADNGDHR